MFFVLTLLEVKIISSLSISDGIVESIYEYSIIIFVDISRLRLKTL